MENKDQKLWFNIDAEEYKITQNNSEKLLGRGWGWSTGSPELLFCIVQGDMEPVSAHPPL